MNNTINWPTRFISLDVLSNQQLTGRLTHEAQYVFSYQPGDPGINTRPCSMTMPVRNQSYNHGRLHPIFEMNLPEGFLRRYIAERLMKEIKANDMLFLALQGDRGIGHLSFDSGIDFGRAEPMNFDELLVTPKSKDLFDYLLDRYGLTHTLSGMQPKLLVDTDRSTLAYPNCIVKTSDSEFPDLAVNEYVCMRLASQAGINVPGHHISDDHGLFVIERFDLDGDRKLAFEDFCSLMGKHGDDRYLSSYEAGAKVLGVFNVPQADLVEYYKQVVFSACIGNGDAHLKNFGLLYDPESNPIIPRLAPAYDITCTLYYEHLGRTLALKINSEKRFPNKTELIRFGKGIGVKNSDDLFESIHQSVLEGISSLDILDGYPSLKMTLLEQVLATAVETSTGLKTRPDKKRKYP